jgi:hypothetical protein
MAQRVTSQRDDWVIESICVDAALLCRERVVAAADPSLIGVSSVPGYEPYPTVD